MNYTVVLVGLLFERDKNYIVAYEPYSTVTIILFFNLCYENKDKMIILISYHLYLSHTYIDILRNYLLVLRVADCLGCYTCFKGDNLVFNF